MTATVDTLGTIHQTLADMMKQLLAVREEPIISQGEVLLNKDGEPIMRKVYPSAAEMAVVTTFLKNNNITAVQGNESKLADLQAQLAERRANKVPIKPSAWTPPDPHSTMPNLDTPWQ